MDPALESPSTPNQQAGSSGTLYAQATKTWVLPPRPKPGRKPKKDAAREEDDVAVEEARKSQNRASQRAFRERRQDQLATLQARLQQYEQGETERYIQLQAIGKRLKDENDQLRAENTKLKEEMAALKAERDGHSCSGTPASELDRSRPSRKRVSSMNSDAASVSAFRKRAKSAAVVLNDDEGSVPPPAANHPSTSTQSNASGSSQSPVNWTCVATPASTLGTTPSSHALPSPSSMDLSQPSFGMQSSKHAHSVSTGSNPTLPAIDDYLSRPSRDIEIVNCGFCSEDTPCICREIARQGAEEADIRSLSKTFGTHTQVSDSLTASPAPSILDNLPPFQPAVPLRKKTRTPAPEPIPEPIPAPPPAPVAVPPLPPSASAPTVFRIADLHSSMTEAEAQASCSGDPNNCDACRGDSFGKAFCSAISATGARMCAGANCACKKKKRTLTLPRLEAMQPVDGSAPMGPPTVIPRNFAWRTLKAHPAIQQSAFNNLDLLAEVVVGGSSRPHSCAKHQHHQHHQTENGEPCSANKDTVANDNDEGGCSQGGGITEVPMEGVRHALEILDRHMEEMEEQSTE